MRKLFKIVTIIILHFSITFIVLSLTFQTGCRDPDGYEPPEDTLISPPDPPQPLCPKHGYVYMIESTPFKKVIAFEWTAIEGADYYHLEYRVDTFLPIVKSCEANACTILIRSPTNRICKHYWRVRADDVSWENFTEWSEQWYFELRWRPLGPELLYPVDSTVFSTDTLPIMVELGWDTVQDEEFYDVRVFKDTIFVDYVTVPENSYTVCIVDTGRYDWQVRAGSSKWEHYSYWSSLWSFWVHYRD